MNIFIDSILIPKNPLILLNIKQNYFFSEMVALPLYSYNLFLILSGTFILIFSVIVFFSLKLRKRNRQILKINEDLKMTNQKLAEQKDIIRRKHLESEKFSGMLLKSADDGISFYNSSWNLKYANPAFYSLIGLDRETYHSMNIDELIHPDDRGFHEKRVQSLEISGFFESELRLKHADGHYVNLLTRSVTVKTGIGKILGALTISRDITKMRKAHDDLVKANEEVKASNRVKSSFLANLSHEIRTPLNSVVGFSNLLLADDISRETKLEYAEQINYNSEKLLQIIGDIIDLSRLEKLELKYEEASLKTIVDEISNDTRQIIKRNDKPIVLDVENHFNDKEDIIITDKFWLKRVLNHLMDNAVKFTFDGSIGFRCSLEDDNIVFRIKDTGIGINKENLVRIFEEFRQEIDGHQRPFEGLGVGLTLSKEVVERMGGQIFVQSEKGIGSEFGFYLPYKPGSGITMHH